MTEMIEVKTADLIGPALDYAVAVIEYQIEYMPPKHAEGPYVVKMFCVEGVQYSPSTIWSQCGPLIEEHRLEIITAGDGWVAVRDWYCGEPIKFWPYGRTQLIAACRAIVATKLGDVVSVSKELMP